MKISDNKSRTENVCGIKIPELEGRVRIELRDARTGHIDKVVEGKNLVTNAVRDIFASNYFGGINYSKLIPIYKELFGGILCFENALTEDADMYAIPNSHTNTVIAHAGQTTYVPETEGVDLTRGNPDFGASAFTTHGFQHVWNFSDSQGNGTIRALALTHKDTGSFWLNSGNSIREFNPYIDCDIIDTSGLKASPLFFDRTNRKAYTLTFASTSSNDLLIYEHCYGGDIASIGLTQVYPGFEDMDTQNNVLHTVTMPYRASDYFYVYRTGYIDGIYTNGTSKIYKSVIDLSTFTVTTTEYSNSDVTFVHMYGSGEVGRVGERGYCRAISIDDDGYIYLAGAGNTTVYKVLYSSMAVHSSATRASNVPYPNGQKYEPIQGIGHFGVHISNGFIIDHTNFVDIYQNSSIFGSGGNEVRMIASSPDGGMVQLFPVGRNYDNGSRIGTRISKLFMSTVKNLEEPVTKLSTQTMTVTYTITEVQEEE